jgi:hypothetical protein
LTLAALAILKTDRADTPLCSATRLASVEANDSLLGLYVAAEMDMRAVGILFTSSGSSPTVSEALSLIGCDPRGEFFICQTGCEIPNRARSRVAVVSTPVEF